MGETQGGIARNRARPIQNLRNAVSRYVELSRELGRAHIERLEFFREVFTRMNSVDWDSNLLAIINNFHIRWPNRQVKPLETNSPLFVNPYAVLARAVTF